MSQSRKQSFIEALTNIVVGYGLAVLVQIIVFPIFDLHATFAEHNMIGAVFTVVSLARSYLLRRAFNVLQARAGRP